MGKIRVTTIGGVDEVKEKEKRDLKREAKKVAKKQNQELGIKNHEGQGVTREEEHPDIAQTNENEQVLVGGKLAAEPQEEKTDIKKVKIRKGKKKIRSINYKKSKALIDKTKTYNLDEAIEVLLSFEKVKFDQSIELHLNLLEKNVSTNVVLPHGIGKETKIAIISGNDTKTANELIKEIEKGIINFDVLIAEPTVMPLLAKVARILGPRGLMPNPKNGTVTTNPEATAKKFQAGQINFKSESKQAVMHTMLGKISFGKEKLKENIDVLLKALDKSKIKSIFIKSTMSPSIRIKI